MEINQQNDMITKIINPMKKSWQTNYKKIGFKKILDEGKIEWAKKVWNTEEGKLVLGDTKETSVNLQEYYKGKNSLIEKFKEQEEQEEQTDLAGQLLYNPLPLLIL